MQPHQRVSTDFAIVVIFLVGGFFSWLIFLTASATDSAMSLINTNYVQQDELKPIATPPRSKDIIMCTMDAKKCPDGKTFVSRTGPKCEFAPCPSLELTAQEDALLKN